MAHGSEEQEDCYGMVFTHLGSIHARYTDVDRLSFQSCIVIVRRY